MWPASTPVSAKDAGVACPDEDVGDADSESDESTKGDADWVSSVGSVGGGTIERGMVLQTEDLSVFSSFDPRHLERGGLAPACRALWVAMGTGRSSTSMACQDLLHKMRCGVLGAISARLTGHVSGRTPAVRSHRQWVWFPCRPLPQNPWAADRSRNCPELWKNPLKRALKER